MSRRNKRDQRYGIEHNEGWIRIGNQILVFPLCQKNLDGCDYVRFVEGQNPFKETAFWTHTEWEEDGVSVMGAIMGKMCSEIPGYDSREFPPNAYVGSNQIKSIHDVEEGRA